MKKLKSVSGLLSTNSPVNFPSIKHFQVLDMFKIFYSLTTLPYLGHFWSNYGSRFTTWTNNIVFKNGYLHLKVANF